MTAAVAHRGSDAQSVERGHGFVLGHCLLDTAGGGPAMGRLLADADFVIAADCRLDNRDELTASLGVPASAGDTEMLLRAYVNWGSDCPKYLLGDFAFAVWNTREGTLFCARDHFGVKPFYYYDDPGHFVFCSEPDGIFASGLAVRRIAEERIADFLVGLPPAVDQTSYQGIRRLPPGHYCLISGKTSRTEAYYTLEARGTVRRTDAPAEFQRLFTQAVQARLRGGNVGAMLSGGLDSSSISGVAASFTAAASLPTFSLVFDETPELNERPFIEAVLSMGGFSPTFIQSNNLAPFAELGTITAEQQELFLAPNLASSRQIPWVARQAGIRVLLDGHGGDNVASIGAGRLHELAAAGNWISLWRELDGLMLYAGQRKLLEFFGFLERYSPLRRLRRTSRAVRRRLGLLQITADPALSAVNPAFAKATNLAERWRKQRGRAPGSALTEQLLQHADLTGNLHAHAFEVLDRTFAAAGTEGRYPFWDKRLVEFCLSLDPAEKLNGGWGRLILRRGMDGILPKEVQWRRSKFDFARHFAAGLVRHHMEMVRQTLAEGEYGLGDYVDLPVVRAAFERLESSLENPNGYELQLIWRTMVLAFWLKRHFGSLHR